MRHVTALFARPPLLLFGLAALVASALPAAAAVRTDPLGGAGGGPIAGSLHVLVVEAGTGAVLPGAWVMVGPRPGEPFAGNTGFTSGGGDILFSDPALSGPVTVTAGAAGHAYFSLVAVNAADLVLPLRLLTAPPVSYSVGDFVSGIEVNNGWNHSGDGYFDMAFVIPAFQLSNLLSFDPGSIMGPTDTVDILGQSFEVPSNLFIPQQWEAFVEIIKDYYHLYLPAGPSTLTALSGRIPVSALINGGGIMDLLSVTQWRKIDRLDVTVSGDTDAADLTVGPGLTSTVTLNLSNLPENSIAYCISMADLDAAGGMGRLIPLGLNALACPAGSGGCAGSVPLTTTAAAGEFSGMTYFPAVAIQDTTSNDNVVRVDRSSHPQSYSQNLSDFFRFLDLAESSGTFAWSDAGNPAAGSPPVDLSAGRFTDAAGQVFWEFMTPGDVLSFPVPGLGAGAPFVPALGDSCTWDQTSLALTWQLPSFDFNQFAFSDLVAHGSHLAGDRLAFLWAGDPASAGAVAPRGGLLVTAAPNPSAGGAVVQFSLRQSASVELAVFSAAGRRVASLGQGPMDAGTHRVSWDGRGADGAPLANGIYVVRLEAGTELGFARIVLRK